MFRTWKAHINATERAAHSLQLLAEILQERPTEASQVDALSERVRTLEVTLEAQFAEATALMVKAGSLKAAARAAEERERRLADTPPSSETGDPESDLSPDELRQAYEDAGFPVGDVDPSGGNEVSPVPEGVVYLPTAKGNASRMKWSH